MIFKTLEAFSFRWAVLALAKFISACLFFLKVEPKCFVCFLLAVLHGFKLPVKGNKNFPLAFVPPLGIQHQSHVGQIRLAINFLFGISLSSFQVFLDGWSSDKNANNGDLEWRLCTSLWSWICICSYFNWWIN